MNHSQINSLQITKMWKDGKYFLSIIFSQHFWTISTKNVIYIGHKKIKIKRLDPKMQLQVKTTL